MWRGMDSPFWFDETRDALMLVDEVGRERVAAVGAEPLLRTLKLIEMVRVAN
jgi:hypothetical protein